MKGLDMQIQHEHAACLSASDLLLALQPVWKDLCDGAEIDTRWEDVQVAAQQLAGELDRADIITGRGHGYVVSDILTGQPAICWALVDDDNVVQGEVFFLKSDAEAEATDWPSCRLVCFIERDPTTNTAALGNIVMAMGFDRERENEHARTHAECAFCREETTRTPTAMLGHAAVCGLHPMHGLLSAVKLVRDGEYGALPLAAMAKLNEALIEVGKAA